MHSRVFLFLLIGLTALVVATSPAFLKPLLKTEPTPTSTVATATATSSPTPTLDPFGDIPIATPIGEGVVMVYRETLPTPSLGSLPPTFTAIPTAISESSLAESDLALLAAMTSTHQITVPVPPPPPGPPPDRLFITKLNRDLPVEPVEMIPSQLAPGVFEWDVPDHRAAGWLNTSAPFGMSGNTVLDGHHNIKGEAFRDLWTLQGGDELILYAGPQMRTYAVDKVLILPERDQPLEIRLANARHIQPTNDERLTLITCWPYESNTHRVVVIAFPK
ncbi:MAG: hypothetical protein BroJett011_07840 [Chloroflexota bacterium]|nr:MAG: hypothetical protein BroJett011_07840 [Chloroflexota bacterium]